MVTRERERQVVYAREEEKISTVSVFLLSFLILMFVALVGFMVNLSYKAPAPYNNGSSASSTLSPEATPGGPGLGQPPGPHPFNLLGRSRTSIEDNNPINSNPGTVAAPPEKRSNAGAEGDKGVQ